MLSSNELLSSTKPQADIFTKFYLRRFPWTFVMASETALKSVMAMRHVLIQLSEMNTIELR